MVGMRHQPETNLMEGSHAIHIALKYTFPWPYGHCGSIPYLLTCLVTNSTVLHLRQRTHMIIVRILCLLPPQKGMGVWSSHKSKNAFIS